MRAAEEQVRQRHSHEKHVAGWNQHAGNIYDRFTTQSAGYYNQARHGDGPYFRHIKYLVDHGWPQLQYLIDFMDKTTVPYAAREMTLEEQNERRSRTSVSVVDMNRDGHIDTQELNSYQMLVEFVDQSPSEDDGSARLLIVEDLSSQVIEILGAHYDIDPHFFRAQLCTFSWYNKQDAWFETPVLRNRTLRESFRTLRYSQPRYFSNKQSIERAKREASSLNVRRRIDFNHDEQLFWQDEKGSDIGLVRATASIWVRPNNGKHRSWLGIVLVDPSIQEGYPMWGGYANLYPPPSIHDVRASMPRPTWSLGRHDLSIWIKLLQENNRIPLGDDHEYLVSPLYELICSQYSLVFEVVNTMLSRIEWELEKRTILSWNRVLSTVYPWIRRLQTYESRIGSILKGLEDRYESHGHWKPMIQTYEETLQVNMELLSRAERILSDLTARISIEEAQNARKDARDISRITYLAFIFVPLSFVSGFLSMNSEFTTGNNTIYWVYFSIAIPMSCLAVLVAIKWSKLIKLWDEITSSRKETP